MITTGVVCSGGGAHGAYEAGVLAYVIEHFAKKKYPFHVITGTSVGAIHAAFLTAMACPDIDATKKVQLLLKHWRSLRAEQTLDINWGWVLRQATGRYRKQKKTISGGLLKTDFLENLIVKAVPWRDVRRAIELHAIKGVAIPATQVATGHAVIFYDTPDVNKELRWPHDPHMVAQRTSIGPYHVLASTAVPLLFPPVKIGDRIYCDGGLRVNTPLSPALRLGADRLLIIRLRPPSDMYLQSDPERESVYEDPFYLLGKVLDSLLIDPIDRDLNHLTMMNALIEQAWQQKQDGGENLDQWAQSYRGAPFRVVKTLAISPSKNFSEIALEAIKEIPRIPFLLKRLLPNMEKKTHSALLSDLFSFILFDGAFTTKLIDIGYEDARTKHSAIEELLLGEA